jgi:hypothetical protein
LTTLLVFFFFFEQDIVVAGWGLLIEWFQSNAALMLHADMKREMRLLRAKKAEAAKMLAPETLQEASSSPEIKSLVMEAQKRFNGRLIRRTPASKNRLGEPILTLQPPTMIVALIELEEWEHDCIRVLGKQDLANKSKQVGIDTKASRISADLVHLDL